MTDIIEGARGALTLVGGGVLGSQLANSTSNLIAETMSEPLPPWIQWLVGPLGALIGLSFALKWIADKLAKAEAKIDKREDERDEDRKKLIEVLSENSTVIREVKEVCREVTGAISNCSKK